MKRPIKVAKKRISPNNNTFPAQGLFPPTSCSLHKYAGPYPPTDYIITSHQVFCDSRLQHGGERRCSVTPDWSQSTLVLHQHHLFPLSDQQCKIWVLVMSEPLPHPPQSFIPSSSSLPEGNVILSIMPAPPVPGAARSAFTWATTHISVPSSHNYLSCEGFAGLLPTGKNNKNMVNFFHLPLPVYP